MAPGDVAIPLIQLIALFLPAWAVVMQVFTKLINSTDFEKEPILISPVALGFSLSILSLYLFGRAGNYVLVYFVNEGLVDASSPLAEALIGVGQGGLAFVGMGVVVLMTVGFRSIAYPAINYVFALTVLYSLTMWIGWVLLTPLVLLIGVTLIFGASMLYFAFTADKDKSNLNDG